MELDLTYLKHRTRFKFAGTLAWMAPELLQGQAYGPAVDLYAFGIVLWEIAAQKLPWFDLSDDDFRFDGLSRIVLSGRRPLVSSQWPVEYRDLMQRCWHENPACRGSFDTAMTQLSVACWDQ